MPLICNLKLIVCQTSRSLKAYLLEQQPGAKQFVRQLSLVLSDLCNIAYKYVFLILCLYATNYRSERRGANKCVCKVVVNVVNVNLFYLCISTGPHNTHDLKSMLECMKVHSNSSATPFPRVAQQLQRTALLTQEKMPQKMQKIANMFYIHPLICSKVPFWNKVHCTATWFDLV